MTETDRETDGGCRKGEHLLDIFVLLSFAVFPPLHPLLLVNQLKTRNAIEVYRVMFGAVHFVIGEEGKTVPGGCGRFRSMGVFCAVVAHSIGCLICYCISCRSVIFYGVYGVQSC